MADMGKAFQPEQLDNIEDVFEEAWAIIASNPKRTFLHDDRLKAMLRDKLLKLAGAGMVDREMVRTVALMTLHDELATLRGQGDFAHQSF